MNDEEIIDRIAKVYLLRDHVYQDGLDLISAKQIIALVRRSDHQRLKAAIGNLRASAKGNIGCSSGILITLHETHEAINSVLGDE